MINAADMSSRFLGEAPTEIRGVLDRFNVGEAPEVPPPHLAEFAGEFLGAMHDDGAALQTLALVLLHEWATAGLDNPKQRHSRAKTVSECRKRNAILCGTDFKRRQCTITLLKNSRYDNRMRGRFTRRGQVAYPHE